MREIRRYPKEVKEKALSFRRLGFTYKEILILMKPTCIIPKNTLSDWCTKARISLSAAQQGKILKYQKARGYHSWLKGAEWNRKEKQKRLKIAKEEAKTFIHEHPRTIDTDYYFLSGLYLGEGQKRDIRTLFANSNPSVIKCYLTIFRKMFHPTEKRFSIALYIRYDQNEEKLRKYWSAITQIPIEQFHKVQVDARTKSSSTYGDYHGVCAICYCDAKIQRFLIELQQQYMCNVLKSC